MRLLPATLNDVDDMERIERSSFGAESYQRELIGHLISDREFHSMLVEVEGDKVGYATFFEDGKKKRARLITIAVLPEYRNRGLAKAMLAFLEEKMIGLGLRAVSLEVGASNVAATNLYLSIGFRIRGVIPDYYGKGKDALYMEKQLN